MFAVRDEETFSKWVKSYEAKDKKSCRQKLQHSERLKVAEEMKIAEGKQKAEETKKAEESDDEPLVKAKSVKKKKASKATVDNTARYKQRQKQKEQ